MSICDHNLELLSDFLDGKLDAARSVSLSKHLDSCSYCRAEYYALRNTIGMLQSAVVPDGARAQRQALRDLRAAVYTQPRQRRWSMNGLRLIPAGAVLAASLAWVLVVHNPVRPGNNASNQDPRIASVAAGHGLPTSFELDEMASQHALHSFAIAAGDAGEDQETLADATSRLH
jgi:anti-sigma factor RsiW